MVDVRFVCVPGVPGVKCTLDGVVKYSDSAGFANFYGLAIGSHIYAVEKQDWQFVSGYAPFMGTIPQSGTMTIPVGWPASVPFALEFKFEEGEEPPAGEFRFDSWNPPLEPRELFVAGTTWPELIPKTFEEGETIKVCYKVKNIGTGPGKWTITVKDLDTGAVIATWYGDLDPGYSFKTPITGATVGKMPNKDLRLEFKVTP